MQGRRFTLKAKCDSSYTFIVSIAETKWVQHGFNLHHPTWKAICCRGSGSEAVLSELPTANTAAGGDSPSCLLVPSQWTSVRPCASTARSAGSSRRSTSASAAGPHTRPPFQLNQRTFREIRSEVSVQNRLRLSWKVDDCKPLPRRRLAGVRAGRAVRRRPPGCAASRPRRGRRPTTPSPVRPRGSPRGPGIRSFHRACQALAPHARALRRQLFGGSPRGVAAASPFNDSVREREAREARERSERGFGRLRRSTMPLLRACVGRGEEVGRGARVRASVCAVCPRSASLTV